MTLEVNKKLLQPPRYSDPGQQLNCPAVLLAVVRNSRLLDSNYCCGCLNCPGRLSYIHNEIFGATYYY